MLSYAGKKELAIVGNLRFNSMKFFMLNWVEHENGSNEYPQCMFLNRNKKNNVYPCKPQFKGVKIV